MVYVGVDLHRKSSHVAVLTDDGELMASRSIRTSPEEFLRVFGELGPVPLEVAFEATYGWGWFADLLADAGIPAHMAHPLATKAIASARVKNDAVDAKTLAHLLRTNMLPEAWIAPPEVREARRLVRTRASMQRMASRLKSQVHAQLADHALILTATDAFGPGRKGRARGRSPLAPPWSLTRSRGHGAVSRQQLGQRTSSRTRPD
jgi:transposase